MPVKPKNYYTELVQLSKYVIFQTSRSFVHTPHCDADYESCPDMAEEHVHAFFCARKYQVRLFQSLIYSARLSGKSHS